MILVKNNGIKSFFAKNFRNTCTRRTLHFFITLTLNPIYYVKTNFPVCMFLNDKSQKTFECTPILLNPLNTCGLLELKALLFMPLANIKSHRMEMDEVGGLNIQ